MSVFTLVNLMMNMFIVVNNAGKIYKIKNKVDDIVYALKERDDEDEEEEPIPETEPEPVPVPVVPDEPVIIVVPNNRVRVKRKR